MQAHVFTVNVSLYWSILLHILMMFKATDHFKLERVYTYKSYVFVSKRRILGFVRYSF